ncbi:DUF4177 domain-containing protein [Roseitranquillus sediminis]|uniref:DUF4177 domain-containing protein n=1 Tax=Roseitranquillus sediminis TaxID=2809051 RepID=UPI001D0C4172|nr:DUF4177 domain-containing protein [Roseitranquillus sediminis]MBM9594627.1 DUF4177 domain-containing protein [Roseitranquillus sediminis]
MRSEYKVVPAPHRHRRIKGVKGVESRFAMTVEELINENATEGWEYVRADRLPCEHRSWLRRRVEEHTLLIFRRTREDEPRQVLAAAPAAPSPRLASSAERALGRRVAMPHLRAPAAQRDEPPVE